MDKVFVLNKSIDTENNGVYFECVGVYTDQQNAYDEMKQQYNKTIDEIKENEDFDRINFETTYIDAMDAFIFVDYNSGDSYTWDIEEKDIVI